MQSVFAPSRDVWFVAAVIAALIRQMLMDKRARAWPNTQPSGEGDL